MSPGKPHELIHDASREATPALQGYAYQIYQTIFVWSALRDDQELYLECAEDFDVRDSSGAVATQVKHSANDVSVTLRTKGVLEAINNYWKLKSNNPNVAVRLQYLSTSHPGIEKGSSFPDSMPGLDYWSRAARDATLAIGPLREFLLSLGLEDGLKSFLTEVSDETLRTELLNRITWELGALSSDAVRLAVLDRLVLHGQKTGINSRDSQKTFGALLKHVLEVLTSREQRRLTFADFCRVFDDACLVSMPASQAQTLIALAQMAETPAPTSRHPIQPTLPLEEQFPTVSGIAPRDSLISELALSLRRQRVVVLHGSTGLGKTSIAGLLTRHIEGDWKVANFHLREPLAVADGLARIRQFAISGDAPLYLVLDDLDFHKITYFEREFLALLYCVMGSGGLVVITSPVPCPQNVLAKMSLDNACNVAVPYLDVGDIKVVLKNHGLDEDRSERWAKPIQLTTRGHPQLVHARIRNMQSKGWTGLDAMDWLQGTDLGEQFSHARTRLVAETPSADARTLVYRLSILIGGFSRKTALRLAESPSPISLPGEAFNGLVGPWIEDMGAYGYRISPLLRGSGNDALSKDEMESIYKTAARTILENKSITPSEASDMLMYALLGNEREALAASAYKLSTAGEDLLRKLWPSFTWFAGLKVEPGEQLLPDAPGLEIMLRLAQYDLASRNDQLETSEKLIDRMLEIIPRVPAGEPRQHSEGLMYLKVLTTTTVPINPRRTVGMLSGLLDLLEEDTQFAETMRTQAEAARMTWMTGRTPVEVLVSMQAPRTADMKHLREFVLAVDALEPKKRAVIVRGMEEDNLPFAKVTVGGAWFNEVKENRLDAVAAQDTLDVVRNLAKKWDARNFHRAAIVASCVLYDEYQNDADKALAVLDDGERIFGANDSELLVARAKVHFGRKEFGTALELFRRALPMGHLTDVDHVHAMRLAAIAAANCGDWRAAHSYFVEAAGLCKKSKILAVMGVGLRADAAFAAWKLGEIKGAITGYAEVLKTLGKINPESGLHARYLHAVVRHSLAWIHAQDRPGTKNPDLAEPAPGIASNTEPNEAIKEHGLVPMDMAWGLLKATNIRYGSPADLTSDASGSVDEGSLLVQFIARSARYDALFLRDEPENTVPVILSFLEGLAHSGLLRAEDFDPLQTGVIPKLSAQECISGDRQEFLLTSLGALAIHYFGSHPGGDLPIERWAADLRSAGVSDARVYDFLALMSGAVTRDPVDAIEQLAIGIFLLTKGNLAPAERFKAHLWIVGVLAIKDSGNHAAATFERLVASQWLEVAKTQRVALVSPNYYAPVLEQACESTERRGYSHVAAILEAAIGATGVRVGESARRVLREVRTAGQGRPA